jgi:hypothetical protein
MMHNIIVEVEDQTFDVEFFAKYQKNYNPEWVRLEKVDIDSVHEVVHLVEDTVDYQPRLFNDLGSSVKAQILKACYKIANEIGVGDILEG